MPSDLPILPSGPPAPPPRSTAEKYGALYQLGIIGLIVLIALLVWFGLGAWSLRGVFRNVYVLHDANQPEAVRIEAAYTLSRDPKVTQRQYWDIALRTELPPLARYLIAESLTAEAVAADPRGYALAVARSPGWPGWLRLLIARPMAYAADDGYDLPPDVLVELLHDPPDPYLRLWVAYTLLALDDPALAPEASQILRAMADSDEPPAPLARQLLAALDQSGPRRNRLLDEATLWLRSHHPEAVEIWDGWHIRDGQLVNAPDG